MRLIYRKSPMLPFVLALAAYLIAAGIGLLFVFLYRIEKAGGIVQSSVTSKTKYLIAGENVGATKTEKAKKLGTIVIDEARLIEMLSGK